jgi:hypothetical protein
LAVVDKTVLTLRPLLSRENLLFTVPFAQELLENGFIVDAVNNYGFTSFCRGSHD